MMNAQMELGLDNAPVRVSLDRRQRRLNRAHWWFDRMRELVDRACDWQPAPPARPEQRMLPTSRGR